MSESITIRDYYDMNKTIFAFAFSLCQFTYSDIRVTSVERMQYGINEKKKLSGIVKVIRNIVLLVQAI